MKEKSYTELMKIGAMKKEKAKASVQEIYVEMLLNEIQLTIEKEKLLRQIDEALERRNRNEFQNLSERLAELRKRFGA